MKSRDTKDFSLINTVPFLSLKKSRVYSPKCFPGGGRIPDHTEKNIVYCNCDGSIRIKKYKTLEKHICTCQSDTVVKVFQRTKSPVCVKMKSTKFRIHQCFHS